MTTRIAAEFPSLDDLKIDLTQADKEVADIGEGASTNSEKDDLPDIPVEEKSDQSQQETSTTKDPQPEAVSGDNDLKLDLDFSGSDAGSKKSESKQSKEEKIEKVVDEIDKVRLETELATMRANLSRLQGENDFLHNQLKQLKKDFEAYVLFRIPKYQEIELPGSKFDPQYIVPHIANALDKLFISVFRDVPQYDFKAFDVISKDNDGNIVNALVKVCIHFDEKSAYSFLKFDLELWIIDGFLQIPTFFIYEKEIYTLNEDGIRRIQMVANRLNKQDAINRNDLDANSWYNIDHGRKNPIIPHQVELPMSTTQTKSWPTHRPY
jgi:hypothetical protein